jgi:CRP/FNR family transcriptional regulator, dissimilatory nitrate respiration regulator
MDVRDNASSSRDQRLVEGVVANLPLFWGVAPASAAAVASQCWAVSAQRGTTVMERGVRLPGIFALAYGSIKLVLRRRDKEERVLRLIAARQTFGESSALLNRPSPYDAVTLQESKLVVIPSASVFALIDRDARFARGLVTSQAEHKLQLYAEIEAATLRSGTQRLASYLHELAGNSAPSRSCTVELPCSKTLVAARLGVTKETLSRLLRQFSIEGIIDVGRREIAILDRERLSAAASSPS